MKKLLLLADTRNEAYIPYKEYIGKKSFTRKLQGKDTDKPSTFVKKVKLFDVDTKQFREQTVDLRVITKDKKVIYVEVI